MSNAFFERPILNSPYEYPARHWELGEDKQPTQRIIDSRRRADQARNLEARAGVEPTHTDLQSHLFHRYQQVMNLLAKLPLRGASESPDYCVDNVHTSVATYA